MTKPQYHLCPTGDMVIICHEVFPGLNFMACYNLLLVKFGLLKNETPFKIHPEDPFSDGPVLQVKIH